MARSDCMSNVHPCSTGFRGVPVAEVEILSSMNLQRNQNLMKAGHENRTYKSLNRDSGGFGVELERRPRQMIELLGLDRVRLSIGIKESCDSEDN
jgi:hypothetical protein